MRGLDLRRRHRDIVHRMCRGHARNRGFDIGGGLHQQAVELRGRTVARNQLPLFLEAQAPKTALTDVGFQRVHVIKRFFRDAEVMRQLLHDEVLFLEGQFRLRLQTAFRHDRSVVREPGLLQVGDHRGVGRCGRDHIAQEQTLLHGRDQTTISNANARRNGRCGRGERGRGDVLELHALAFADCVAKALGLCDHPSGILARVETLRHLLLHLAVVLAQLFKLILRFFQPTIDVGEILGGCLLFFQMGKLFLQLVLCLLDLGLHSLDRGQTFFKGGLHFHVQCHFGLL